MRAIITKAVGGFFFAADKKQHIYRAQIRGRVQETVYPGDRVEFEDGMIEKLYSRDNLLHRPAIANVDQVLVMQSLVGPPVDRRLLDRFLVMVEAADMEPVVVINKTDLQPELDLEQEFADYVRAGYRVYFISVKGETGMEPLIRDLRHKVNVLTGPSGVGKSSLINQVVSDANLVVGEISNRLGRGMHTTRHVELLPISEGGWVADTPGFTSLDTSHLGLQELTYFFPEFDDYLSGCRFRLCSHTHEPGCAVKQAVEAGEISTRRYDSYRAFYQEITERK